MWRQTWHLNRVPCPLLDLETHQCGFYDDRPSLCRAHHAGYTPSAGPDFVQPPIGCFARPELVARGEMQRHSVISRTLGADYSNFLTQRLEQEGHPWHVSLLGLIVLDEGRKRFGWPARAPRPMAIAPRLSTVFPSPST
jgi:hypothetical protein